MKKKYRHIILFVVISAAAVLLPVLISSNQHINKSDNLLDTALKHKTYYDYLTAYNSIVVIDYESTKNEMLDKLNTIADTVYNEDIKQFNAMLEELKLSSDIRLFNKILLNINNSNLDERDKTYLTGVLSMWGTYLIFTPDYIPAMNAVNIAWSTPNEETISNAEALILDIKSDINRDFLLEELNRIKQQ